VSSDDRATAVTVFVALLPMMSFSWVT
jgi:hypothetical protein